jgi:plastocyanin domain-containing protein
MTLSKRSQKENTKEEEQDEPNMDGVVEVSFKIDNEGKVQILNMNSTSPQLAEYVIKKLNKIQLQQGDSQVGKIIRYRFVFKKQA